MQSGLGWNSQKLVVNSKEKQRNQENELLELKNFIKIGNKSEILSIKQ